MSSDISGMIYFQLTHRITGSGNGGIVHEIITCTMRNDSEIMDSTGISGTKPWRHTNKTDFIYRYGEKSSGSVDFDNWFIHIFIRIKYMAFEFQDLSYTQTLESLKTRGSLSRMFPGNNKIYRHRKWACSLVAGLHENMMTLLSEWQNIGWNNRNICDIRLPDKKWNLEVKACALHERPKQREFIFRPSQLDKVRGTSKEEQEKTYLGLCCYIFPHLRPEMAVAEKWKFSIEELKSLFIILMRYSDCLELSDKRGLRKTITDQRNCPREFLSFSTIEELIQERLKSSSTVFANAPQEQITLSTNVQDLPQPLIVGIGVNPRAILPGLISV